MPPFPYFIDQTRGNDMLRPLGPQERKERRNKREKEEREGEEKEGFGVQPCAAERNHQESLSVLQLFKVIS